MAEPDPEMLDEQVIDAAIRVFASEATGQVTLKRVALEAGVPSDQVTARWSSTTELLAATIDRLSEGLAVTAGDAGVPTHGSQLSDDQVTLLDQAVHLVARAVLDQIDPTLLTARFPVTDKLVAHFQAHGADLRTARYRAYQLMVLEFGARLFSPWMLVACQLEDEPPSQIRAEIEALQQLVAQRSPLPADQVA